MAHNVNATTAAFMQAPERVQAVHPLSLLARQVPPPADHADQQLHRPSQLNASLPMQNHQQPGVSPQVGGMMQTQASGAFRPATMGQPPTITLPGAGAGMGPGGIDAGRMLNHMAEISNQQLFQAYYALKQSITNDERTLQNVQTALAKGNNPLAAAYPKEQLLVKMEQEKAILGSLQTAIMKRREEGSLVLVNGQLSQAPPVQHLRDGRTNPEFLRWKGKAGDYFTNPHVTPKPIPREAQQYQTLQNKIPVPPLPEGRFTSAWTNFAFANNITVDDSLLIIDGRRISLAQLHAAVAALGGTNTVTQKDWWPLVGGRMGWASFDSSEGPRCASMAAERLQHVYTRYVAAFDQTYHRQWYVNAQRSDQLQRMFQAHQQQQLANGCPSNEDQQHEQRQLVPYVPMGVDRAEARTSIPVQGAQNGLISTMTAHMGNAVPHVAGITDEQRAIRLQSENIEKVSLAIEQTKRHILNSNELNELPSFAVLLPDVAEYAEAFNKLLVLVKRVDSELARFICLLQGEQVLPNIVRMIELMRYQRQQGRYILSLHNAWLLILHLTNMIAAVGMQSVPQNEAQVPGYATSQNQLAQQMNAMRIQEQDIRTSQHRMDMYFNVPGISAEQCALRLQPDNVNKMSMLIERVKQQLLATTEFNEQPSLAIAEHETFEYAETFNKLLVLVEQIESDLAKVICLLEDEQILPKVIEIIGLTRYQRQQASRNRYILTLDKMRQFVQHFTVLMVGAGMQVGPNGVQLSSAPWGSMFPVQSLPPTESMVNVIVTPQNVLTSGQSNKEPAQEGGSSVAAGTNSMSVPSVSWAPPSDEQKLRQEEEEAVAFLDRFAAQFHHDGDDDDDDAKLLR